MVRNCRPIDLHLRLGTLQFVNFQIDFQMAMRELLALLQIHPDDAIIRGGLLTAADGSEPTTLVLQSHQVSLLIRIVRPSAPEYQDHLQVHNSATIGRSPQAHLQIDDRCVSRRHARIDVVTVNEGAYVTVMDLGSANGTFLNGELLQTPRRIVKGDTLALGNCELQILDIA
ncbi:MAG TPA: hypothetical protein DDY14_10305 [Chromatiaceae bacterium]|nr:MAG: FHA domain-containing protein [Thiohalocapsa sp. PB-PSB1]HBG95688.1 hypothetical protein [Chromatiaceae bacterium]HCS92747.1 hypothetical protein [Chromatiaceae bacterium]